MKYQSSLIALSLAVVGVLIGFQLAGKPSSHPAERVLDSQMRSVSVLPVDAAAKPSHVKQLGNWLTRLPKSQDGHQYLRRNARVMAMTEGMSSAEFQQVLDVMLAEHEPDLQMIGFLLERWVKVDPEAACYAAMQHKLSRSDVFRTWWSDDPEAAWIWSSNYPEARKDWFSDIITKANLASALIIKDPDKGISLVNELSQSERRKLYHEVMFNGWHRNPQMKDNWIENLGQVEDLYFQQKVLEVVLECNSEQALSREQLEMLAPIAENLGAEMKQAFDSAYGYHLMISDPPVGLAHMLAKADDQQSQKNYLSIGLNEYAKQDASAAIQWVADHIEVSYQDEYLLAMATPQGMRSSCDLNPEVAEQIQDPRLQQIAYLRMHEGLVNLSGMTSSSASDWLRAQDPASLVELYESIPADTRADDDPFASRPEGSPITYQQMELLAEIIASNEE
ncbi:hypothetical protein [Persicirhabdus sediminis]|uniref:DUF4034 domain-containing protein n=1 Tax=Persicirhabdus sediminis TaxID=454144 RepID=A0A8J7SMX6_9BACT|nr:hypothetical protein [Persicirhabdus sediminis]MBK1792355.1 hypothetical protein [Persicirhabdus sediminis]